MTMNELQENLFCNMRRIKPFLLCHHSLLNGWHLLEKLNSFWEERLIVLEDQSMNPKYQSGDSMGS